MFTVEYVKDLKWADAGHTVIECVVKYAEFEEEHPSGIVSNDIYQHIRDIWAKAVAGGYGPIQEYVAPPEEPTPAQDQPASNGLQTV